MNGIRRLRHHCLPIINTQVSPNFLFYHFLVNFRLKKRAGTKGEFPCRPLVHYILDNSGSEVLTRSYAQVVIC